jgi:hypothetical protein
MARDFLAIQGSSVPCERVFSSAGLTDTKRRGGLLPENFGAIQIVKGHFKKERKAKEEMIEGAIAARKARWYQDIVGHPKH